MKRTRKLLALLICLCMTMALIPVTAFAAGETEVTLDLQTVTSDSQGEGWSCDSSGRLTLETGYAFTLTGNFSGEVENSGVITAASTTKFMKDFVNLGSVGGGTFFEKMTNKGSVSGGTFEMGMENSGTVTGGTFTGGRTDNEEGAVISGVTLTWGTLYNHGTIKDGLFGGNLLSNYGVIENGTVSASLENSGVIQNGTFTGEVYNKGIISGGSYSQLEHGETGRFGVNMVLTNLTSDPAAVDGWTAAVVGSDFVFCLTADAGYALPEAIQITRNETELAVDSDYTYDSRTGEVTVNSSAISAPLCVTASGIEPVLSITAPVFDSSAEGYTQPAAKSVTITNLGQLDAAISSVTLTGDSKDCFILAGPNNGVIAAGTTDSSSWSVQPKGNLPEGVYTATIQITYNEIKSTTAEVNFTVTHSHVWSGDWRSDEAHHWHDCTKSACPVTDNSQKDGYAEHISDGGKVTKEATETEKGVKTYSCTVCGYVIKTEEIPVITHSHTYGTDWKSDETNHWHECTSGDGAKTDLANHVSDGGKVTKEATESEKGVKTYSCTVCGRVLKTEEIPAAGTATDIPQTGDNSSIALWLALLLMSAGGLTGAALIARKRKHNKS